MTFLWVVGIVALVVFALSRLGRHETRGPTPTRREVTRGVRRLTTAALTNDGRASRSVARWVAPGDTVTVAGRQIGGMIYLGSSRDDWQPCGDPLIDPGLPVARVGSDVAGESMPYWPSYSDLESSARATYLDWLASGRSDERYSVGYVFLYFYGLERRFFVDSPAEEERRVLIDEVERLLSLYGTNHSVRGYLTAFLAVARLAMEPTRAIEPRFERSGYGTPLDMRVAIGRMVRARRPLSADWLLGWYATDPQTQFRTPARRAFPEFKALFAQIFDERFPQGMKMRTPKRLLRATYDAASGAFSADLEPLLGEIPDITRTSVSLRIAKEIADEATGALDKYSRFLGRNPEGRDTVEAHALLPQSLWQLFPNAEMEDLRHWAEEIIDSGGFAPVERVVERLEGALPEKVHKRQLTGVADALARLSIGMAPDPRFALRGPKVGEPVVLFRLPKGIAALEEVSDEYRKVLVGVAMGGFVAHSDGRIAAKERAALEARIAAASVPHAERLRLLANLQWILAVSPDLALLRRRLKGVSEDVLCELGRVALAMAAVDGVIDPAEIRAIEGLYKAMGLKPEGVYSDLHALSVQDEPTTVRLPGEEERGFTIPPPPERNKRVVLDDGRLAALMADTARVSDLLGDIFQEDQPDEQPDEDSGGPGDAFAGLDSRHAAFLRELLTRSNWDEAEYATLAARFQLMRGGALETLNEWSFDRFGDMLIDEYEGYELNGEILAELRQ